MNNSCTLAVSLSMRALLCAAALLACASSFVLGSELAPSPAPASAAEPSSADVKAMIAGLGHDSFQRREESMKQLIAAGSVVESNVIAAVEHGDPEVRYRAAKVLREIEKSQVQERRLRFIAGDTAALKQNAASWRRLAELLGNTRETRELFVQMQTDGGELLDLLETDPARCAGEIANLYQREMLAHRGMPIAIAVGVPGVGGSVKPGKQGLVLAMMFAAGSEEVQLDAGATNRAVALLYRFPAVFTDDNQSIRKLLGRWMDKQSTDINAQFAFLRLAQQHKLPQGLSLARKLVSSAPHASNRAQAVITVAQLGGAEDIATLEKLIGDNTTLGVMSVRERQRKECKLGDVALAMCIVLSGQKVKDFGFESAPEGKPLHSSYVQYGFMKEPERAAARAKWAEYRKVQASDK